MLLEASVLLVLMLLYLAPLRVAIARMAVPGPDQSPTVETLQQKSPSPTMWPTTR